jgi:alanine racemase
MIQKGEAVGYDFTEKVKRTSTIAVIPIGYWHGFPRLLSGKAHVIIHGKRAKVLGRVSMDMIVVDVTGISRVKTGDTVTLIGRDGKEEVSAEEMARLAQTTPYEVLTRLNPRMEHLLV